MAKPDHEPEDPKPAPAWGTWEDLLLGFAVERFGTEWDVISSELQKRTSIHITPADCQQNYTELKRRFNQPDDGAENVVGLENRRHVTVPWLEELRNIRVTELQRELKKSEIYITHLQSEVKRLTEEQEINGEKMTTSEFGHNPTQNEIEQMLETNNQTVEPVPSDSVSDRDNQSVNGSNGNPETEPEGSKPGGDEPERAEPGSGNVEPGPGKGEPDGEVSEAPESIAESKSEGKNSDAQSSASKRKEKGERVLEPLMDEQSKDSVPVRSLPLVDLLQKLRKIGSVVLEPRLDRQEKMRYKNLIREYIDYETLQTRLKEGWYSDGNDIFFRDLLLVVSNTRIFFPKESPESIAARDLRLLILKEMLSTKKQLDTKPTDKQTSSKSSNLPPKRANESADSLLLKPKLTGPIVVCRKRSSITAKAAGSSLGKKEQTDSKSSDKVTDETPKRSRDSFNILAKKKGKSPVNETSETKPEKTKKLTEAEEKKQSAAKFLNRMKRSNEPLLSSLKSSSDRGSENDSKSDQKKSSGSKGGGGDGKKDQAGKKSSGGRQTKEQDSPAKRSVGRPPKRAAVLGKRNREPLVDSETVDSKQTRKRSKR